MAHIHNAILRGYNSIYQQAAHVKEEDKAAFVGYTLAWYRFVKSHHDDEEAELFPRVEEVLGVQGVWDETHAEHGVYLLRVPSAFSFPATRPHLSVFTFTCLLACLLACLPSNKPHTNPAPGTPQNPSYQASHP
jgi:hypothetical protein